MRLRVRVIPRAKRERIEQSPQGLKVYLSESPRQGRANKKLIEILARHFHTKKRDIKILKGLKQREKIVKIGEVA